ncbi:hypothetical protein [Paenibacillus glycinis]|uniref:Group-specific protein n=1 Tax=Paenibacillus glycinis TaxID=2697035 RepID=A0ABW9XKY2_9BACL|nr:hypothetical protein [Paenibacillus glycinis]NBD23156.1 hypothetical protein [Paenibacillus glycinis]
MTGLIVLVVIVLLAGLVGTIMIGESKDNKKENPGYFQNTDRKWRSLSGIYVIGLLVAGICLLVFFNH